MSDWIVIADNGKEKECASRNEAELIKEDMEELGLECEIEPPGETDGGQDRAEEVNQSSNVEATVRDVTDKRPETASETIVGNSGGSEGAQTAADAIQSERDSVDAPEGEDTHAATSEQYDLPDKPPVDTDPMEWVPSDFVDTIQGQPAINRKGYEVMAAHYDIGTTSDVVVGPEETGFDYCRVKATATTSVGVEYQAHGSAHVDRGDDGDDREILLEMADTRARKRAVAQATGVGMIAVQEIQNKP